MKRFILAASAAAAFAATAGVASAADNTRVDITAEAESKCGITAQNNLVTLSNDLTDANAFVRAAVTDEIATALNSAKIVAFCNKAGALVTVKRSVLALDGSTGNGLVTGGFAQLVRYNLDTSLGGVALDSTSTDGGSVVPQRFGGHNSLSDTNTHVRFATASSNGPAVATAGSGSDREATTWGSNTDRRLAAGNYSGYVTIQLAPAS
jgi:hypothetical protein